MPATESTWRDQKLLHVIFGLTALSMFLATIFMLVADHRREWKPVQRKYLDLEEWTAQTRAREIATSQFNLTNAKLGEELKAVEAKPLDDGANQAYQSFLTEAQKRSDQNRYDIADVEAARSALAEAPDDAARAAARDKLVSEMKDVIQQAKFDEDKKQGDLKMLRARADVKRSEYDLDVHHGAPAEAIEKRRQAIDEAQANVDKATGEYQEARAHREALEDSLAAMQEDVAIARKAFEDHTNTQGQLDTALAQQHDKNWWQNVLELPIIDGFSGALKVEQIWLPKLTLNNNFRDVARFDRCTTCHLGMEKTAPGSAVAPGYPQLSSVELTLNTPEEAPGGEQGSPTLRSVYGLTLADQGLFDPNDPTVQVVLQESRAALAGLQPGDVITGVKEKDAARFTDIRSKAMVNAYLLESVKWGEPLTVKVRRGAPQPFSSHPRLDLFVGSTSPHKMQEFGCTICHQGQGSATDFKYASHTPNTWRQMKDWQRDHEWYNNHHWILPMLPDRFQESSCLKCHHDVVELRPSPRFPDPPAPKVVHGYDTIRTVGCYGCHEIVGYDGPKKRIGPDLRAEPNYYAAAQQLLFGGKLTEEEVRLAQRVVDAPQETGTRKRLAELLKATPPVDEGADQAATKRFQGADLDLISLLNADDETPGSMRKVGPSLRHVGSKLDFDTLYRWIRRPQDIRPTSKMPQFFGLWDHLSEDAADPQRFEPVEVRAIAEYLLSASQPFETENAAAGDAARGKTAFQTRGCLACHSHQEFPEIKESQGPNLSSLARKLNGEKGRAWLVSWLREPKKYHVRTAMPNVFLTPTQGAHGATIDPAADIAAYLLSGEQAPSEHAPAPVPDLDKKNLDDLAYEYLSGSYSERQAREILANGIDETYAADVKGDDRVLIGSDDLERKKLLYVGRRTIGRLGCAGCHDIPGFETAKTIGTGLVDWGRKEPAKLAFEQIVPYLESKQSHGAHGEAHGDDHAANEHAANGHGHIDVRNADPDDGFYLQAILNGEREGFIWQKIREPRSYDYKKDRKYLDRLRMPKFYITEEEREAAITFVLGLVAEPPVSQYVYQPGARGKAIVAGQKVLDKFNCAGCHTMQMEQWTFDYDPKTFEDPPPFDDYHFLKPQFTAQELAASARVDRRGLGTATVEGMKNPQEAEDDDGNPLFFFAPWQPVAINGHAWPVGGQEIPVPAAQLREVRPPVGGDLSRYLHPVVTEIGKVANPNLLPSDVWGWLPPPLLNEGTKVKPDWLHDFLLDPHEIRPAAVLRMPRFNMSSEEATALSNYFAARDNAEYPYSGEESLLASLTLDSETETRLEDAMRVVTSNTFCVKCHLVGDFVPPGSNAALAPNLARVYRRLRPEFLLPWIANPKRLLPYTGMPVNFPPNKPADSTTVPGVSDEFPKTSEEQVRLVVELLSKYDVYMQSQTQIKDRVKEAPVAEQPQASN